MAVVSQSAFAKSLGVDHSYINRQVKGGNLPGVKGGIDTEDPQVRAFVQRKKERDEVEKPGEGSTPAGIRGTPKIELEKMKLAQQIKQIDLVTAIKRGDYVHKELIQRFFAKLYAIENGEVMRIGDRLVPVIVGVAGIKDKKMQTKLKQAIEKELYSAMGSVQKHFGKYLEKNKETG